MGSRPWPAADGQQAEGRQPAVRGDQRRGDQAVTARWHALDPPDGGRCGLVHLGVDWKFPPVCRPPDEDDTVNGGVAKRVQRSAGGRVSACVRACVRSVGRRGEGGWRMGRTVMEEAEEQLADCLLVLPAVKPTDRPNHTWRWVHRRHSKSPPSMRNDQQRRECRDG